MHYLGKEEVRRQLGPEANAGWRGHSQALLLQNWLNFPAEEACWNEQNRTRYAASLITRADAELYCFSYPRFAVRTYLDATHSSFINLRRTQHLKERILDAVGGTEQDRARDTLLSMIGDCVLRVPNDLAAFQFVPCNAAKLYGNEKSNLTAITTPFVNYSDSSGSCAFAVAFMASALLGDHCTGLLGLTEMPFILGELKRDKKVTIGDVPIEELCLLLGSDRIGLCAYHQETPIPNYIWFTEMTREELTAKAITSYAASGMPVIIPCDLNLIHGHGDPFFEASVTSGYTTTAPVPLYQRDRNANCGLIVSTPTRTESENHFLLCVGVNGDGNEFVLHDPYGMPYLTADADTLKLASYYTDNERKNRGEGQFISVTPRGALLPLLGPAHAGSDEAVSEGCLAIAMEILSGLARRGQLDITSVMPEDLTFRLVDRKSMASQRSQIALQGVLPEPQLTILKTKLRETARDGLLTPEGDWVWLVFVPRLCCLVIDATKRVNFTDYSAGEEIDEDRISAALLLTSYKSADLDEMANDAMPHAVQENAAEEEDLGLTGKPAESSLISSFSACGLFVGRKDDFDPLDVYFQRQDLSMELYAFMQDDLALLMKRAAPEIGLLDSFDANLSVVRNLASLYDNRGKWSPILAKVIDEMVKRDGRTINICGLATFIPGATSADKPSFERSCQAMGVINDIARELQDRGHSCQFIEMVMGSRVEKRTWKGGAADNPFDPTYMEVETADVQEKMARLTQFFGRVHAGDSPFKGTYLFELEPGPSFVLNGLEALEVVATECRKIEDRFAIKVGFNLDIAHWMLAGIDPLAVPPSIVNLIGHCHICDSSCGHMDDSPLFDIRGKEAFRKWFELLDRCVARSQKTVDFTDTEFPYSGYVSLELECAKRRSDVERSLSTLATSLRKRP